ncbi:hypothetical protein HPB50_007818 [Hyalomma asiaticum]|uniref:Uncharacterized protein n=1 Tax=Hyalomma asiaticum TaxID=266040 RepID=A0ACB7S7F9_HYAAI|nr:hypothetical protein HPB50_007818 [Hyalomma asiaticum]
MSLGRSKGNGHSGNHNAITDRHGANDGKHGNDDSIHATEGKAHKLVRTLATILEDNGGFGCTLHIVRGDCVNLNDLNNIEFE